MSSDAEATPGRRDAGTETRRALVATLLGIGLGLLAAIFARREERE